MDHIRLVSLLYVILVLFIDDHIQFALSSADSSSINSSDRINDSKRHHVRHKQGKQQQQQSRPNTNTNGNSHHHGIIVVPGLGRADRIAIVKNNLSYLESTGILKEKKLKKELLYENDIRVAKNLWDCVIYVYARRNNTSFWHDSIDDIEYINKYCHMIEVPDQRISSNMYMLQPALLSHRYEYVFILLDDIELYHMYTPTIEQFTLQKMISLMQSNQLTVLSPRVINSNRGGGQDFRLIMQKKLDNISTATGSSSADGIVGYSTCYLELFAWLMTATAYEAFWQLHYPSINPYGWGHDFW